jgi:hypothetical protein
VIMSGDRMSEEVIRPEGIPSEEAFGSVTVFMRGYFSTQLLWSAERFIRLAAELEPRAHRRGSVLLCTSPAAPSPVTTTDPGTARSRFPLTNPVV